MIELNTNETKTHEGQPARLLENSTDIKDFWDFFQPARLLFFSTRISMNWS